MEKTTNLLSVLSEADLDNIQHFLNIWSGCSRDEVVEASYYLREWAVQKQPLYHMFGDNLILKKKIKVETDCETNLKDNFTYDNNALIRDFYGYIKKNLQNKFCFNYTVPGISTTSLFEFDGSNFFENNCHTWFDSGIFDYIFDKSLKTGLLESDFTLTNKETQETTVYKKGTKIMRFFGKLAKELDIPEQIYFNYSQSYSRYWGVSSSEETLVLSIHPLDYMTMSMSGMKWRSCMSWDEGEYHLGTVEMMNNAYTVVAYIEGSRIQDLNEDKYEHCIWNTKKWRELFYVLPTTLTEVPFNFILEGKAYPKINEYVTRECMKWLAELFNNYYSASLNISTLSDHFYFNEKIFNKESVINSWNKYNNNLINKYSEIEKDVTLEKLYSIKSKFFVFTDSRDWVSNARLTLEFLAMYDDLYLFHYIIDDIEEKPKEESDSHEAYYVMLSGRAICAKCGEYIPDDDFEPSSVFCRDCSGFVICADCGEHIREEEAYSDGHGNYYCDSCWRDHVIGECARCGEEIMDFNNNYCCISSDLEELKAILCDDCIEIFKNYLTCEDDDNYGNIYKFDWEKVLKDIDTYFPVGAYRKTFDYWTFYKLDLSQYLESLKKKVEEYLREKGNK